MKTLKDGTNIPSRMWYYMLDFLTYNQEDEFKNVKISELNCREFQNIFNAATFKDFWGIEK